MSHDALSNRVSFVLEGQRHCDHFLTPIASPEGKRVLVIGTGAGTEALWCLKKGAARVLGIDIVEQEPAALQMAARKLGVDVGTRYSSMRLPAEHVDSLREKFDLVLSNNVFEHVSDIQRTLSACARVIRHDGRVAVFTDPLYYSSVGSHLSLEPWEHLWGDGDAIRERLLRTLPADHALHRMTFPQYLFGEITLNRMRLTDFVAAARESSLAILNLRTIADRNLSTFGDYRERIRGVQVADLTTEGIAVELGKACMTPVTTPIPPSPPRR
jgi:SAM-dependent methyltransferase